MKFSTRQDIEAPVDFVFSRVTDFDAYERRGLRRGIEVTREDPSGVPGLGTKWKIRAKIRGKARNIRSKIVAFDPPNGFRTDSESGGLSMHSNVELLELAPRRTRMTVQVEMKANTLTARLLLQSLKFAKSTINARVGKRTAEFAKLVEEAYRSETV